MAETCYRKHHNRADVLKTLDESQAEPQGKRCAGCEAGYEQGKRDALKELTVMLANTLGIKSA